MMHTGDERQSTTLTKARRACIVVAILSIALFAASGMWMAIDESSVRAFTILTSAGVLMIYSIMLLANLHVIAEKALTFLVRPNAVLVIVSAGFWLLLLWIGDALQLDGGLAIQIGVTLALVATANTLFVQLYVLKTRIVWLRLAKFATAAIVYVEFALILSLVWELTSISNPARTGPGVVLTGMVLPLGVLGLASVLLVPMLIRLAERRSVRGAESIPLRIGLDMTCPECGSPERLNNGPAKCTACGYRMMIEVDEPRCDCGYLLFRLTGENCPECGRAIPADQRWLANPAVSTETAGTIESRRL